MFFFGVYYFKYFLVGDWYFFTGVSLQLSSTYYFPQFEICILN